MAEPKLLAAARRHLAQAEDNLMNEVGLFHLLEGLALLESVIEDKPAGDNDAVARNLGQTYASRIYARLERDVGATRLAEPELEQVFAVLRTFDDVCFDLPPRARELKIEVVRRLIDFYSDGQSPSEKALLFERLAGISGNDG